MIVSKEEFVNRFIKLRNKYEKMPIQARASIWFFISNILQKGIHVITTPIFTRLLTTGEYGQFHDFTTWQSILSVILILYLPWGVYQQGIIKYEDDKEKFTSALLGLATVLIVSWSVFYYSTRFFWNDLLNFSTFRMFAMFGLMWLASGFSFWAIQKRSEYHYKKLLLITLLVAIIKPITEVLMIKNNSSNPVDARITAMLLVDFVFYFWLIVGQLWKGKVFFSWPIWRYAIRYNVVLVPHYLSQTVLNGADKIMIKRMIGDAEAGIYSLAYSLSNLMSIVSSALIHTLNPWYFRRIKNNNYEGMATTSYLSLILVAAVNIMLIGIAPEIVYVFAPVEYHNAIWIVPPVTMGVYFMFMYSIFAAFEFYYEKTKWISIGTMICAVTNIILNFIFIKIFGYYAAGYTTLLCYLLYALAHYYFMNKINREIAGVDKIYKESTIFKISAGFVLLGFLLMSLYNFLVIRVLIIIVIILMIISKKELLLKYYRDMIKPSKTSNEKS